MLPVLNPEFKEQINAVADLIMAETNVKNIEFLEDTAGVISKKIKPNFKALGKRLGCLLYTSPSPRDQRGSRMPSSA